MYHALHKLLEGKQNTCKDYSKSVLALAVEFCPRSEMAEIVANDVEFANFYHLN